MRPSLDQYLMEVAKLAATRTTCIRRGVGCVLANARGHILAVGYNGVAAGMPHCNKSIEVPVYPTDPRVGADLTPEGWVFKFDNKVTPKFSNEFFSKTGGLQCVGHELKHEHTCKGRDLPPGQDSCEAVHAEQNALLQCRDPWEIETAYVTLSPCKACLKLLLNTSCRRIVVLEEHIDLMPRELWLRTGRAWEVLNVPPQ